MAVHHHSSHDMVKIEKESHDSAGIEVEEDQPHYPWGMTLHLENELIEKLDLGELKSKTTIKIKAIAFVESTSENTDSKGKTHRSITLQLTEIGIGPAESGTEAEERLYGGGDS